MHFRNHLRILQSNHKRRVSADFVVAQQGSDGPVQAALWQCQLYKTSTWYFPPKCILAEAVRWNTKENRLIGTSSPVLFTHARTHTEMKS